MDIFQIKEEIRKNKDLLSQTKKEVAELLEVNFNKIILSTQNETVKIGVSILQRKTYDLKTLESLSEFFGMNDWSLDIENGMTTISLKRKELDEKTPS